jgi:protocatechuate 3,4-dioxygenase beta subunit
MSVLPQPLANNTELCSKGFMADDAHDQGLHFDLVNLAAGAVRRRQMLQLALSSGATSLLGCDGSVPAPVISRDSGSNDTADTSVPDATGDAMGDAASDAGSMGALECTPTPAETAGPFPGNGTIGPNVLNLSGIVRRDIRASIAGATGVAAGVMLTVQLKVVSVAGNCTPLAGRAVYVWHCDREGNYSMYSPATADENYLRGAQETDDAGVATFITVFPGCYPGRWPHIHFAVYPSLAAASAGGNAPATSQLAFPENSCREAYTAAGYEASVQSLAGVSLSTDGVFADGVTLQLASMSGNAEEGFVATLTVAL